RMSHRRGEHLRLDVLLPICAHDVGHDAHAVLVDVVEPTRERADDVRADRGREQGLIHREAERHVDPRALSCEDLPGAETFGRERHLHDHVGMPLRDAPAFYDHVVGVLADDLRRDVTDDPADALDLFLVIATGLGDEGGVRGDAVDDAPLHTFGDLFVDGAVAIELHVVDSSSITAGTCARPFARAYFRLASMNEANSGCGRFGRDLNSGWYCVPR